MELFTIIFIFALTVALAIPLGKYIAKVYAWEKTFLDRIIDPIEKFIFKFILTKMSLNNRKKNLL